MYYRIFIDFFQWFLDKGEVFGWGNNEYSQMSLAESTQQVCTPRYIKIISKLGRIKSVASAGSFCIALNGNNLYYPTISEHIPLNYSC